MTTHPVVVERPAYTLTKLTGTLFFQLIAQSVPSEKLQIISLHPGLIYNDAWKEMGLDPGMFNDSRELFSPANLSTAYADDSFSSDSDELCGGFAVWAASKNAAFLHGRFVWTSWDIEELSTGELRKRIDEDPLYLRASIVGLN